MWEPEGNLPGNNNKTKQKNNNNNKTNKQMISQLAFFLNLQRAVNLPLRADNGPYRFL